MTTVPANAVHASIAELVRAYLAAEYRWHHGGDWHDLRIGLQAPALELLYPDRGTFGMLSAWNPRSVEQSEAVNREADRALRDDLASTGLPFLPAFGSALDRSWREPGWVVMGMSLVKFDALSRKYIGQDYANPIGPHGRVILRIAADKTNTPRTMSR